MDVSSPLLSYFAQSSWSCPSSDSEVYNISSPEAGSPASYMDFSPSTQPSSSPPPAESVQGASGRRSRVGTRRSSSKNPSKQRQSASEKEKLRMRDLTKALHHLRTYLPPSVAPVGQSLTKIETLRLTIRYISYLSAQLGSTDQPRCQIRDLRASQHSRSPQMMDSSNPEYWGFRDDITAQQELYQTISSPQQVLRTSIPHHQPLFMAVETPENFFNSSSDSYFEGPLYQGVSATYQVSDHPAVPGYWG